jgi:hypothetical protein
MPGFLGPFQNNSGYQNLYAFLGIIYNAEFNVKTLASFWMPGFLGLGIILDARILRPFSE